MVLVVGFVGKAVARTLQFSRGLIKAIVTKAPKSVTVQSILFLSSVCFFSAGDSFELWVGLAAICRASL